jgi:hypothetical protein
VEHRVRTDLLALQVQTDPREHLDHRVRTVLDLSLPELGILTHTIIKMMLFIIKVAVTFLYKVFLVMVQYYYQIQDSGKF